jgi:hypothetical protein
VQNWEKGENTVTLASWRPNFSSWLPASSPSRNSNQRIQLLGCDIVLQRRSPCPSLHLRSTKVNSSLSLHLSLVSSMAQQAGLIKVLDAPVAAGNAAGVLARLAEREEERAAATARRLEELQVSADPRESVEAFLQDFAGRRQQLEVALQAAVGTAGSGGAAGGSGGAAAELAALAGQIAELEQVRQALPAMLWHGSMVGLLVMLGHHMAACHSLPRC